MKSTDKVFTRLGLNDVTSKSRDFLMGVLYGKDFLDDIDGVELVITEQGRIYLTKERDDGSFEVDLSFLPATFFGVDLPAAALIEDTSAMPNKAGSAKLKPLALAYFLAFLVPKKHREEWLGDLEEQYAELYERAGRRYARAWFFIQVLCSVGAFAWARGKALYKKHLEKKVSRL